MPTLSNRHDAAAAEDGTVPGTMFKGASGSFRITPEALATTLLVAVLPIQSLPGVGRLPTPMANFVMLAGLAGSIIFLWRPRPLAYSLRYPLQRPIALFIIYACVSILYGKVGLDARSLSVLHLTTGDQFYVSIAIQRVIQILLCIGVFELIRRSRLPTVQIMAVWLSGMLVSSIVHFGIVLAVGTVDGRPGTFAEGNFAGLFYVFSLLIALEYNKTRPHVGGRLFIFAALLGLALAKSSTSFAALGIALLIRQMLARTSSVQQKIKRFFMLIVLLTIPVALILTGNDFGLTNKLFSQEVTPETFSRIDRLLALATAAQIFGDAPVFGSGLQSYGFIANIYLDDGPFSAIYDFSFRRIPNNIYAEIGSELGLVGLALFFGIIFRMIYMVYKSVSDKSRNMLAGLVATLVYWLAFPTYSVIFVWAFFGLAMRYPPPLQPRKTLGHDAQRSPYL